VQRRYQRNDCESDLYDVRFHDDHTRKCIERKVQSFFFLFSTLLSAPNTYFSTLLIVHF
jgi:SET domain-containing protein